MTLYIECLILSTNSLLIQGLAIDEEETSASRFFVSTTQCNSVDGVCKGICTDPLTPNDCGIFGTCCKSFNSFFFKS